jgi:hypothetical protein
MTFNFFPCRSATRRRGKSLARMFLGVRRALRAGFAEPRVAPHSGDATSGRYFGLLVHVNGSGR